MNVTKSPIDVFLEQRLEEDKIKLGTSLNDSLQKEMACLDLIKQSIDHCKKNIGLIDKLSSKGSISAVHNLQIKKDAFRDNLKIWNMFGQIQMVSIELKKNIKNLTSVKDDWIKQSLLVTMSVSIYETSKKLIDETAKVIKILISYGPESLLEEFKASRKKLTSFSEEHKQELIETRNTVGAHRDEDVSKQISKLEGLELSHIIQIALDDNKIILEIAEFQNALSAVGFKRLEKAKVTNHNIL